MNVPGRKRKLTDEQVKRIREWVSFAELCRFLGVKESAARHVRYGYVHKQPSP
jgi:hypothetical protein